MWLAKDGLLRMMRRRLIHTKESNEKIHLQNTTRQQTRQKRIKNSIKIQAVQILMSRNEQRNNKIKSTSNSMKN